MKTLISSLAVLSMLSSSVYSNEWKTLDTEPKDKFTVAAANHDSHNDLFIIRFNKNDRCKANSGVLSKVGAKNKDRDYSKVTTPFKIRIDKKPVWFTDTTNSIKTASDNIYFYMTVKSEYIQQLIEGDKVRINIFGDMYQTYDLTGSRKAITTAMERCINTTYKAEEEDFFSDTGSKKKTYNPEKDFF